MIYKTLHWYIFRELLRNFLLVAAALTILMAFGSALKPITKQGMEVTQLLWLILNAMPAMLAYTIPLAALFSAVQVYWRLSTDNEIVACRAGGVSFWTVLAPALALGVTVALVDLVFVNYVVPVFIQRMERAARQDLGSMIVYNVARGESFSYANKLVVYADWGEPHETPHDKLPPGVDRETVVELRGMAAAILKDGKPTAQVVAERAYITLDQDNKRDEVRILVRVKNGYAFNPNTFEMVSGSVESWPPDGKPYALPSALKDKIKFLNIRELWDLARRPDTYPPVADALDAAQDRWMQQQAAQNYLKEWAPGKAIRFDMNTNEYVVLTSPKAALNSEMQLTFAANTNGEPVLVRIFRDGRNIYSYFANQADLTLTNEELVVGGTRMFGSLALSGNVQRRDVERETGLVPAEKVVPVGPLTVAPAMTPPLSAFPREDVEAGRVAMTRDLQKLADELRMKKVRLSQDLLSEVHSRVSFATSCLTLVLLGGALGIMMRGRNPLLVFAVGFLPAVLLVLLITAGRKMVESSPTPSTTGLYVIWMGNMVLAALVGGVYSRLLRQ